MAARGSRDQHADTKVMVWSNGHDREADLARRTLFWSSFDASAAGAGPLEIEVATNTVYAAPGKREQAGWVAATLGGRVATPPAGIELPESADVVVVTADRPDRDLGEPGEPATEPASESSDDFGGEPDGAGDADVETDPEPGTDDESGFPDDEPSASPSPTETESAPASPPPEQSPTAQESPSPEPQPSESESEDPIPTLTPPGSGADDRSKTSARSAAAKERE